MWIVQILITLSMEIVPLLIKMIIIGFIDRKWGPKDLKVAALGLRIAIMLGEIRKGSVEDFSKTKAPKIDFSGRLLQLLDMTEAEIDEVNLSKAKLGRGDSYKLKANRFQADNALINILDLSKSEVKMVDFNGARINVLDLSEAKIGTLNISHANILNLDLSEAIVNNMVGGSSAEIYLQARWKARILKEEP